MNLLNDAHSDVQDVLHQLDGLILRLLCSRRLGLGRTLSGKLDSLLNDIEAARFDGDTDRRLVVTLVETPSKESLDNIL